MVINKLGILGALDVEVKVLKECLTVRPPAGHFRPRRRRCAGGLSRLQQKGRREGGPGDLRPLPALGW